MKNEITYDSRELIGLLERSLDDLGRYRFDSKYISLLGRSFTDKLSRWNDVIRKQKDLPLTVVVCGEFKRGKSSLINAFLGENVVTTNVTTETVTTNRISYGAHANEIVLSGGRRMKLDDEDLKCENLRGILASLPEKATSLELRRPLEILKQVTIIDTPGLGDAMQDFSADVAEALRQADAVVYVFSVMSPLSVQEQLFIKTVIKPQKYTELFLVGNAADTLETETNCLRMQEMLEDRLRDILPGEAPLLLSALDERCRQLGTARPEEALQDYLTAGFDRFRAAMETLLEDKKDCLIPDRIQRLLMGMAADLSADLAAIREGLSMDEKEIAGRREEMDRRRDAMISEQEETTAQIDALHEAYLARAVGWIEEFVDKMCADTDTLRNESAEDVKRYYSLYCVDTMQAAMERCADVYITALYEKLDEISRDISRKLSLNGEFSAASINFAIQNRTWTRGDNFAMAGEYVGGYVGAILGTSLVTMATDFIGGAMREQQIRDSLPELIETIRSKYPAMKRDAVKSLRETFKKLTAEVKKEIAVYFEEQSAGFAAQLEQSAAVARQDAAQKEQIAAAADEIEAVLRGITERFGFFTQSEEA